MFDFIDIIRKWSTIGAGAGGSGVTNFAPYLGMGSSDPDLQRLNQTAFDINSFFSNQIEGTRPVAPTQADLDQVADNASLPWYDPRNVVSGGLFGDTTRAIAVQGAEQEYQTSLDNFNTNKANFQSLAPAIGGLAALQELNMMEGAEQARQQKLNFQNPNNFRVNPTNGLGNFYAEEGGNMHDNMKQQRLPKDYKIPRINLTNTPFDVGDDVQLFRQGGMVTGHTKNFDNKVNTYGLDLKDRYFSGTNRVPVQTESGKKGQEEMIVLPTLDLLKVNADKRHKRMDEDQVTDYVPEGSYILSQFGDVKVNRDEAENLTTEVGIKPYDVFGKNDLPTRKSLADVMTKKEMSPADIARNIKRKFKQVDREDPFTKRTNDENKLNSLPYIQGLVLLSEIDKNRKGLVSEVDKAYNPPSGATAIQPQTNIDELPRFGSGGIVRSKNVPKAVLPALVAPLIGLGSTLLGGLFSSAENSRARGMLERNFQRGNTIVNQTADRQQQNNAGSLLGTLAALGLQDTTVEAPQLDDSYIRNQEDGIAQPLIDAQINRLFRNNNNSTVFQNAPSFAAGVAAQNQLNANAIDGANNLFFQQASQGVQNRNNQRIQLGNLRNQQIQLNNQAEAGQRAANNNRIGGIGSAVSGYFNTDSNIEANRATGVLSALGQQTSGNLQLSNQQQQTFANVLTGVNQFLPQVFAGQTQTTQTQPNQGFNFGSNSFANGTRQFNVNNPLGSTSGGTSSAGVIFPDAGGNCPRGYTYNATLGICMP